MSSQPASFEAILALLTKSIAANIDALPERAKSQRLARTLLAALDYNGYVVVKKSDP